MPKRNGRGIDLLADPTRRSIVAQIALGFYHPAQIAKKVGLSRPATSRQLRILYEAGLVKRRRASLDRRGLVYWLEPRRHGQITAWLAGTEVGRTYRHAQGLAPDPFDSSA